MSRLSHRCQPHCQQVSISPPATICLHDLQIQLYPITNTVILQRELILERSLTLALQHNLMWLPSNTGSDLCFEEFYPAVST